MPKLDGSETLKPTPYDAHEQVVRGPHKFVPGHHEDSGYKPDLPKPAPAPRKEK